MLSITSHSPANIHGRIFTTISLLQRRRPMGQEHLLVAFHDGCTDESAQQVPRANDFSLPSAKRWQEQYGSNKSFSSARTPY
jgi:hypothetical protein